MYMSQTIFLLIDSRYPMFHFSGCMVGGVCRRQIFFSKKRDENFIAFGWAKVIIAIKTVITSDRHI